MLKLVSPLILAELSLEIGSCLIVRNYDYIILKQSSRKAAELLERVLQGLALSHFVAGGFGLSLYQILMGSNSNPLIIFCGKKMLDIAEGVGDNLTLYPLGCKCISSRTTNT